MTNHKPVNIYISAAADLAAERELLARMIAELPVTLAWRIGQTPLHEFDVLDLETVQTADLHILVIGTDIRAPVGLEWQVARYHHRLTLPYLKHGVSRTLAGQSFVRDTALSWQPFNNPGHLRNQVQQALVSHLERYQHDYALTLVEVEQLQAHLEAETSNETAVDTQGAGHNAIILSRERYEPSDGVSLEHLVDQD